MPADTSSPPAAALRRGGRSTALAARGRPIAASSPADAAQNVRGRGNVRYKRSTCPCCQLAVTGSLDRPALSTRSYRDQEHQQFRHACCASWCEVGGVPASSGGVACSPSCGQLGTSGCRRTGLFGLIRRREPNPPRYSSDTFCCWRGRTIRSHVAPGIVLPGRWKSLSGRRKRKSPAETGVTRLEATRSEKPNLSSSETQHKRQDKKPSSAERPAPRGTRPPPFG